NNFLSPQGVAVAEEKLHQLWLHDTAPKLAVIRRFIKTIDRPQHEFLLKARIVSVDDEYVRDLGILFQSSQKSSKGDAITSLGSFAVPIANLGNGGLLDVELNALEKNGHAKVVSSPQIVVLDHHQAMIESGEEVPYQQETVNGGTNVAFKKAVLKLEVTPHLLTNNRLLLDLHINQDKVSALTVQGVPAIHTQQLTTQVELNNEQTLALGGIYELNRSNQHRGVPFLNKIPLLGYLFRTHHQLRDQREMLVFITVDIL
ncbi:MAG: secretin, partial [Coxiella sp. (in: Bacteria)]